MSNQSPSKSGAPSIPYEHNLEWFIYLLRLAGVSWAVVACGYFVAYLDKLRPMHLVLLAIVLTYPHVAHLSYRRNRSRTQQLGYLLVDAFFLGWAIYLTHFSLLPALTATAVALGNALALNGFRWLLRATAALTLGLGLPTFVFGAQMLPQSIPQIDMFCGVFLLTYFLIFAYATFTRTIQLLRSRRELREQKAIADIERKRAEGLLLSLVPAGLTKEFRDQGRVLPRRYEEATLVVVEFVDLDTVQQPNAIEEWFGTFNHYLQAFDATAARYRLESLQALGSVYCAVSGLPSKTPTHADDALGAAIEMRRFAHDFAQNRQEGSSPVFTIRIAVHTGQVIAGIAETRRFSYKVCGPGWSEVVHICQAIRPWDIAVSQATRRQLSRAVPMDAGGSVQLAPGRPPLEFYLVESTAAPSGLERD